MIRIRPAETRALRQPGDPLASLCALYWQAVYAYLRQRGHAADDAEDLSQGFFAHVIAKRVLDPGGDCIADTELTNDATEF